MKYCLSFYVGMKYEHSIDELRINYMRDAEALERFIQEHKNQTIIFYVREDLMSGNGGFSEEDVKIIAALMSKYSDFNCKLEFEFNDRAIKQYSVWAKELNVPVIVLSQLSRSTEGGQGHKPMLSDLRESGSIEQDADMVLFIHRPDFVGLSENPEDREKTQIIIAKHRNGETKDIDMVFKSEQIRFMEIDEALDVQAARPVESAMNSAPFDAPYDAGAYGAFPTPTDF